jgi:hypothetical protein
MAPRVARARIALSEVHRVWEVLTVLEWKPRFAAVLVVLTLVLVAALASGYVQFLFDNWEW